MPKINEAKLHKFLMQHLDREVSFKADGRLVMEAANYIGYSRATGLHLVAARLDKELARLKESASADHIPTNNRGDRQKRYLTADEVIARGQFPFTSTVVRSMFDPKEYRDFVVRYCEAAIQRRNKASMYIPTENELAVYESYDNGLITLEEAQNSFGLNNNVRTSAMLGRIYAYKKEQSRVKNAA